MFIVAIIIFAAGLIRLLMAVFDRRTTGWNRTRLKFVPTSLGLILMGLSIMVADALGRW